MKFLRFLPLLLVLVSCSAKKETIPPLPEPKEESRKVVIYQLMTRLFGNQSTANKRFGTKLENGVGKFNDINTAALQGIRELGVTHIWYTGVIEHATQADYSEFGIARDDADVVKGLAGSPYAIKDYYDVDPDLAVDVPNRMLEFEQLINRTHANQLKVIIDFVPNHVARSYHSDAKPPDVQDLGANDQTSISFLPSNNFYYLPGVRFKVPGGAASYSDASDGKFEETPAKVTGNNVYSASPTLTDWYETVKLNYGVDFQNKNKTHFDPVPSTWLKMKDILIYWTKKGVDGFRCDMAEMVPVEFWSWVIPQVQAVNPSIIFIAEIYNPQEYNRFIDQGNFDYLYDKVQLYDTIRLLTRGLGSTTFISSIQERLSAINNNMLHFLENHDEQRVASSQFAGDMWKAAPAMTISATIDKGPVMIYFGQEVGEKGLGNEGFQGEDGRTTIYDYWGVPAHQAWMNNGRFDGAQLSMEQKQIRLFYKDLLNLASKNQAIVRGDFHDITAYNIERENFGKNVYAYVRSFGENRLLIVTGFNDEDEIINIELPKSILSEIGLSSDQLYIARDLLWKEVEVGLGKEFSFELKMKPYSCFIFKIK